MMAGLELLQPEASTGTLSGACQETASTSVAVSGMLPICTRSVLSHSGFESDGIAAEGGMFLLRDMEGEEWFTWVDMLGGTAGWGPGTSSWRALAFARLFPAFRRLGRGFTAVTAGLVLLGPEASTDTLSDACDAIL